MLFTIVQQFYLTCPYTFTPVQLCTFINFPENFYYLVSLLFLLSPELILCYVLLNIWARPCYVKYSSGIIIAPLGRTADRDPSGGPY